MPKLHRLYNLRNKNIQTKQYIQKKMKNLNNHTNIPITSKKHIQIYPDNIVFTITTVCEV